MNYQQQNQQYYQQQPNIQNQSQQQQHAQQPQQQYQPMSHQQIHPQQNQPTHQQHPQHQELNQYQPQQTGYQPNASTYSAYPEYDPESTAKQGVSYQYKAVVNGWNDPPVRSESGSETKVDVSRVVKVLMSSISLVRNGPNLRLVQDTEKRIDFLVGELSGMNHRLLKGLDEICTGIESGDWKGTRARITDMMMTDQEQSRWLVGLKRMVDLLEG